MPQHHSFAGRSPCANPQPDCSLEAFLDYDKSGTVSGHCVAEVPLPVHLASDRPASRAFAFLTCQHIPAVSAELTDLNLIAVELARLGIWIHTFVPGMPTCGVD
jgi:hypothetical protein